MGASTLMQVFGEDDVETLLDAWPRLRRLPVERDDVCILAGLFEFRMEPPGLPEISDSYHLRMEVPLEAPRQLLRVFEEGGRLRHHSDEHINNDGSFCMGSPLRLQLLQLNTGNLLGFVKAVLVPFLYAASWRAQGNAGYPFQELAHFGPELVQDYGRILSVQGSVQVANALWLLSLKLRNANKHLCPRGCGRRLGACTYHRKLNSLRKHAPRALWRHACQEFLAINPLPPHTERLERSTRRRL